MLLKERGIRHLPVVDVETGNYMGLLTQRSLLNHAFNIIEKFGMSGLEKREQRTDRRLHTSPFATLVTVLSSPAVTTACTDRGR